MKDKGCPYTQYHGKKWKPLPYLKPFGTMAMVPATGNIRGKNSDKGVPMIYCGPAADHAKDVCRFLNPETKRVIEAKPSEWMNVTYGEWKGVTNPIADSVGDDIYYIDDLDIVDTATPTDNQVDNGAAAEAADGAAAETANPPVRNPPPEPDPDARVLRAMRQLKISFNPDATDFVDRHTAVDQPAGRDGEQAAINCDDINSFDLLACLTMLDRLQLGSTEFAMTAQGPDIKPEQ